MIDDAPPLIAIRGQARALALPLVAIVGSRNASGAGLKFTQMIAHELGEAGFAVVSGLARGIDAAPTPQASPPERSRCSPAATRTFIRRNIKTSSTPSCRPAPRSRKCRSAGSRAAAIFPRRNRLISGLSLGVVIVEAAKRSGSLITARFALEQGREVFAVPGSPLDPRAEGTNGLIKQGATPVTEAADIVSVLRPIMEVKELPAREPEPRSGGAGDEVEPAPDERARIVALLGPAPVQIDDLVRLSKSSPAVVPMVLLELEIAGRLERHGGGLISLA